MKEFTLKVASPEAGMRLDLYLLKFLQTQRPGLSRNFIQKLIRQRNVVSEGNTLSAHYKIKAGQVFKLQVPDQASLGIAPEDIPLDIRFEDEDVAVVNKPAGMVVHPGAGNYQGTLVNALLFHCASLSSVNPQRPGIVHRLDKDTSGLIVVAKNDFSHEHLSRQFAEHSILRQYTALVKGRVEFNEDVIELPIGRHPYQREKMSVFVPQQDNYDRTSADYQPKPRRSSNIERRGQKRVSARLTKKARYAKTRYRVIRRSSHMTLLELTPFTGRTHQLRVHLSSVGHPILGDKKYGRDTKFSRLALHAHRIGFIHPRTNKLIEVRTAVPEDFLRVFQ